MSKKKSEKPHGYRYLPAPGTGRGWSAKFYYRTPKTAWERKMDFQEPDVFTSYPLHRGGRRTNHLPMCWDDGMSYRTVIKNWKRYRKTQWREKPKRP